MADNGKYSAFPWTEPDGNGENGLTKREYMATQFMAALIISPAWEVKTDRHLAQIARRQADALLVELDG